MCYFLMGHTKQWLQSEEIKIRTIPVEIFLHLSDLLEIQDMNNWAEAVGMRERFRRKILLAKEMHKSLDSLQLRDAWMIEILAATDIRLTFRTMRRL